VGPTYASRYTVAATGLASMTIASFRTTAPPHVRDVSDAGHDTSVEAVPSDARITVVRQSPDDVGFREIFVSLDGEPIGILRHGETLSTEVPSGPHRLRAHNTLFWKTHHIVLKPGEHITFTAINRAGWGTFGLLFFLGAMPVYLTFEPDTATRPA
jgi:hypothetical protein